MIATATIIPRTVNRTRGNRMAGPHRAGWKGPLIDHPLPLPRDLTPAPQGLQAPAEGGYRRGSCRRAAAGAGAAPGEEGRTEGRGSQTGADARAALAGPAALWPTAAPTPPRTSPPSRYGGPSG